MAQLSTRRLYVHAHRGFSEVYPENTLLAFRKAIEAGVQEVELDIGLTADEAVVVIHDATLDRTTDGTGPVVDLPLAEICQLDAGSWKGTAFAGERVPTLSEALEAIQEHAITNIEIKSRGRNPEQVRVAVEKAVAIVKHHHAEDRVIFASFDMDPLLEVRKRAPELRLMLIDWDSPEDQDGVDLAIEQQLYGQSGIPMTRRR